MALPCLWEPVVGWEGHYWVSNTGKVRGRRGELRHLISKTGYHSVCLEKGSRSKGERISKYASVHRLVAKAFVPNPHSYPQVNHKDENKSNNNAENLEWCTAKYNMNYGKAAKTRIQKIDFSAEWRKEMARRNGAKTTSKKVIQINKKGEIVAEYKSIHDAARAVGMHRSTIARVASGKKYRHTAGGYKWAFSEGVEL